MSQVGASPAEVAQVIGRGAELASIECFLDGSGQATCLALSGEPGIGKTTLWEAGLELARQRGHQVLSARASEGEATLSFVALADLMDGLEDFDLGSIPAPQWRALEVALRRADPEGKAPDPFGVAAGFLGVIRLLQERAPLLIAIDDVEWLDAASSDPLLFAVRRLSGRRTRFLLSRRTRHRSDLERVLTRSGVQHLEVKALSFGATGRMLSDRLGTVLSRRTLRRVHGVSHGNPLLALELGRLAHEGATLDIEQERSVTEVAEVIFGARIRETSEPARRVLLAVSLSPDLSPTELSPLADQLSIEEAVGSGLVVIERSRIRASHPMLAAVARADASVGERRALHLELSAAVADPIVRARHIAMATEAADAEVAEVAAAAADLAASGGRVWDAVDLGQHALRLTPVTGAERAERVVAVALFLANAGRYRQTTEFLLDRLSELPAGRLRARAHLLLYEASVEASEDHLAEAIAHAGDDAEMQALLQSTLVLSDVIGRVRRIDEAETWARTTLESTDPTAGAVTDRVTAVLAWARVLLGKPIDDLSARDAASPNGPKVYVGSIERPLGVRLAFRGQVEAARTLFGRLTVLAEERGELVSVSAMQMQLCEIELRAGRLDEATRLIDEFEELLVWEVFQGLRVPLLAGRLRALYAALAGDPAGALRWAATVLGEADHGPQRDVSGWDVLETRRAVALVALFQHDAAGAVEQLAEVWDRTRREHVGDPGAFPVAGDLVEALVRAGRLEKANEVLEELRRMSLEQDHPWGLATTRRGEALVRLASAETYDEAAAEALAGAAACYGELGLVFEQARSMLCLGVIQRRFKKRGAARSSLEQAAALFEAFGAAGWAEQARDERGRVSGRRSRPDDKLTATEQSVAKLAADGLSNRDIAAQLFVSVKTVEANLSRAYAKLGVRSRAELAHHLVDTARQ